MDKLRDHYQLVLRDEDTLEEVANFKLSPLSVYIGISSLFVFSAILVTMMIIWTPLKRYIPGYGDVKKDSELAELRSTVKDLRDEARATKMYTDNFRKILVGDVEDFAKLPVDTTIRAEEEAQNDDFTLEATSSAAAETGLEKTNKGAATNVFVAEKALEQILFTAPVKGPTAHPFRPGEGHLGIDLLTPKSTPAKAALDGTVIFADYSVETGHSIGIQHAGNVLTWYKHCSVALKKMGQQVKAGEAVGIVGNTGEQTTGPHLHFELWHRGRAVNPADYINFN